MTNLFARLFAYRTRAAREPLEDFLTEAFADLFDRLAANEKRELFDLFLTRGTVERLMNAVSDLDTLRIRTQVAIPKSGKRPDIVVSSGDRKLFVIEVKVGAAYQEHEDERENEQTEVDIHTQLETYARWMADERKEEAVWPGAVVLLTAWTEPPADFVCQREDQVITNVVRWKQVGQWLAASFTSQSRGITKNALATDLYKFIEEKGLMTKYPSARDLAAAMIFTPSCAAIDAMFYDNIEVVAKNFPKLSASRHYGTDWEAGYNTISGSFYLSKGIPRIRGSKPYIAVGICFYAIEAWEEDAEKLPPDQPFFFVELGVERGEVDTLLTGHPDGWVEIEQNSQVICSRPVTNFPAHPDQRVAHLQAWAKEEIHRLTSFIKGYETAAAGPLANKKDEED